MEANNSEIIGHGAEAIVYLITDEEGLKTVVKQRRPKKYRHPDLDQKINESRVKSESKILQKLSQKGFPVPRVISVDPVTYSITMNYIPGTKLKDHLISLTNSGIEANQKAISLIATKIGLLVKDIHEMGIIHGDLTTSNMILHEANQRLYVIDFGLSYSKTAAEDRAVDLYVLERAFISTHPELEKEFKNILIHYGNQLAIKRLELVRQRGRKKVAFG